MKCPLCVERGQKSQLTGRGTSTTLMGWSDYYDEDGNPHSHNPNRRTSTYYCSNYHYVHVTYYAACPSGDYDRKEEIRIGFQCDVVTCWGEADEEDGLCYKHQKEVENER